MTPEDVDVHFFPGQPAGEEPDDWARTVAAALRGDPGAVTVVFVARASAWRLSAFHWYPPHAGYLEVAPEETCRPLRRKVYEALRRIGKNVVLG